MSFVIQTDDFDELSEAQIGWNLHYRLISGGAFCSSLWVESNEEIQLDCETWNQSIEIQGLSHPTNFAFVFSARADRSFFINGQHVCGNSLVALPPGIEIHAVTGAVGSLFSVSLDKSAMTNLGEGCPVDLNLAREKRQLLIYSKNSLDELRNVFERKMAGSIPHDRRVHRWHNALVKTAISRVIQNRKRLFSPTSKNLYRIARHSRDYMMSHLRTPISIPQISREIGASERSIHYAFQSVYGTTPKAFLKLQRMAAARTALIKADPDESIRSIMIDFGFVDAGHFARDYRQQFGELPSETIRRYG